VNHRQEQITQEELSQKIGLANRFLQDIQSGNKQASITTLFRLADGLEVSPNDLLENPFSDWEKAGKPV
jgi:transcriptional regulator with XRE-family HTH domain